MSAWWNIGTSASRRYNVTLLCDRGASGRLVTRIFADLAAIELQPTRVIVADEGRSGRPVRVDAQLDCSSLEWRTAERAVRRLAGLPGIRSVACTPA